MLSMLARRVASSASAAAGVTAGSGPEAARARERHVLSLGVTRMRGFR